MRFLSTFLNWGQLYFFVYKSSHTAIGLAFELYSSSAYSESATSTQNVL